jgi:hypothetical protein
MSSITLGYLGDSQAAVERAAHGLRLRANLLQGIHPGPGALGPVEDQGFPRLRRSCSKLRKGVCHGPVLPDGCAMGEDAGILPG